MTALIPFIFFFFQAEDGIRDIGVTGVQTCALPIYQAHELVISRTIRSLPAGALSGPGPDFSASTARSGLRPSGQVNLAELSCRSEERRVGKECRSRWSPYH